MSTSSETPLNQPPASLLKLSSFLLIKLGKHGTKYTCEALAAHNMKPQHYAVIASLDEFGSATQKELADRLRFDTSDMVALLDDLGEQGFIDRQRDEADRRRQIVHLTTAGKSGLKRLTKDLQKQQDEFLTVLSETEQANLHKLLSKLYADVRSKA